MSFYGTAELTAALENNISPFDLNRIESGKYELSLGETYYSSDFEEFKVQRVSEKEQVVINPGQFALLITQEKVKIPGDCIGFISIKAGIKFRGIVNISGFHVDPGFDGKLKFSVFNAGTNKVNLQVGRPVFQLWLAKMSSDSQYTGSHQGQEEISSGDINKYMQGEVASPSVLKAEIDDLKSKKERNLWYLKFVIGLLVALAFRFLIGWTPYDSTYTKAIQSEVDEKIEKYISSLNLDSLVNSRIDALSPKTEPEDE